MKISRAIRTLVVFCACFAGPPVLWAGQRPAVQHPNAAVTPEAVAAHADSVMVSLKNTLCNLAVQGRYGQWGRVAMEERIDIHDHLTYWAQYYVYRKGRHDLVYQVSNGKSKTRSDMYGLQKLGPSGTTGHLPPLGQLPELWWRDMPHLILDVWVENRPVFSALIASYRKAGFDVQATQTRTVQDGHTFVDDIITIQRAASQLAPKGAAKTVIEFDHSRGLPVLIQVETLDPKKEVTELQLRAFWEFHHHFAAATFSQLKRSD
jgi:hypothetical protein